MSALPPKADMDQSGCDVRFVMKTIGIVLVARWGCQRHRDNYVDTLRKVINGSRDFGLFCGIFRTLRSAPLC